MTQKRAYTSPVREERAKATRDAILTALFEAMQSVETPDEIGMALIARKAGVERRTIFRHFETREKLFAAFWDWLNDNIGVSPSPRLQEDIVNGPRHAFARFDDFDAVMRAMLHTQTGREMRANTIANRQSLFAGALEEAVADLTEEERSKVVALAHLLYSASAWEVLKDYGGLTGAQAGEAASWALEVILSAVTQSNDLADKTSHAKETGDDS